MLESECGSLPESDGSSDFECWHRLTGSTTDVEYLGIDFQAVLFNNQDLVPPDQTFVSNFNASIDYMKANATQAMRFVETIPADMRINTDHCNLSLGELLLPPTTVLPMATTTIIAPATVVVTAIGTVPGATLPATIQPTTLVTTTSTVSAATLPATVQATVLVTNTSTVSEATLLTTVPTTTTNIALSPTNTVASSDNGSRQTGFNATLLLLSAILLLILTH